MLSVGCVWVYSCLLYKKKDYRKCSVCCTESEAHAYDLLICWFGLGFLCVFFACFCWVYNTDGQISNHILHAKFRIFKHKVSNLDIKSQFQIFKNTKSQIFYSQISNIRQILHRFGNITVVLLVSHIRVSY